MLRMSAQIDSANGYARINYKQWRMIATVLVHVILIVACLIFLYPMVIMVINSFKSNREIFVNPAGLPRKWTLSSYAEIFQYHSGLWRNYIVSIVVATSTTIASVTLCALAAFSFAKFEFRGRNLIFALLLSAMMVPHEINIPGRYIMFAKLGLLNTIRALILPNITPILGLFLIRQYMLTIPDALIEAARIDGAGYLKIFWKIIVPVSAPILGAFAILQFMGSWNDYLWPSIVVLDQKIQPIMVVLPRLTDPQTGFERVWGTIMAGNTLATIPILLVFIKYQSRILSSVVVGAIKE
jgi:ABC-type glycerol-3-phosphate transport system permease component